MIVAIKGLDGMADVLNRMGDEVAEAQAQGVLQAADFLAGVIREVVIERSPGGKGGLARSWRAELTVDDREEVAAEVYSDLVYAGIQDRGGTIRPKTRKNLAIPLRPMPIGKWPRHFGAGQLTLIRSRRGNLLLVEAEALKRGEIRPVFVLKKEVQIPAKNYLAEAEKRAEPEMTDILGDFTIKRLAKVPD